MRVVIVEGSDRLLQNMSTEASTKSRQYLEQLEVEVITGHTQKSFDGTYVSFDNGDKIKCHTLIWTAGITGEPLKGIPETSIGKGRRIVTDEYNQVVGCENLFAIGDIALLTGKKLSQRSPASSSGSHTTKQIVSKKFEPEQFRNAFSL